jgi:hypothetical protein
MARAEQLASSAGSPQGEAWIEAQEALSAAVSARTPTAVAQSDIDAIAATSLQKNGGIAPNDLKAISDAAAAVSAMEQRQAQRIRAVQQRLAS